MKNRKGEIRISRDLLKDELELAQLVFANFVPVFISNNPIYTHIEYYGYSIHFDEIDEGVKPPRYDAILINESGTTKFKEFVKVESESGSLKTIIKGEDLQFILNRNGKK